MLIEYVGLQLPKYIKHAFYIMQIHHHRHAPLHRNAPQQTCNNKGWDCFTNYFVFPAATHLRGLGGTKNPEAASQA